MKKIVLITGGSSGLGLQLVQDFVSEGHEVISVSRSEEKIKKAIEKLGSTGCKFISGDISKDDTREKVSEFVRDKYGKLDVLINNAGITYLGGIEVLENNE